MNFLTGLLLGGLFSGESNTRTPRPKMYKLRIPKRPEKPSIEEIENYKLKNK